LLDLELRHFANCISWKKYDTQGILICFSRHVTLVKLSAMF